MGRHSFIQMSKLPNVKGRISYISSHARQENLYAVYETTDRDFWKKLAAENQQEFKRSGTEGKCIEARELIIALPESYTELDPNMVLKEFTDSFKKQYGVECIAALHHNKRKTNYHIHLIFAERTLLPEPEIKTASRAMYYDETGKHVRTKKEITGEDGKPRPGCTVIKKGEIYEQHLFSIKNPTFKSEAFLDEAKHFFTALINSSIQDPELHLKVFDQNSVYLPTKKIGKNNPKAAEIEADNAERMEWNRTADLALVSGVSEETVMEVRNREIYDKATVSVQKHGWLPGLFRGIVQKARAFLEAIIRKTELPPKPTLRINIQEFNSMKALMSRLRSKAAIIKDKQEVTIPMLKAELEGIKGLFKGKERRAVEAEIQAAEQEVSDLKKEISDMVKKAGYPDGQTFMAAYNKAEKIVKQYNADLAEWERRTQQPVQAEPKRPPEKRSIIEQLRQIQTDAKQKPRITPKRNRDDWER